MRVIGNLLLVFVVLGVLAGCGPKRVGVLAYQDKTKVVKTVYVWDVDGHIDINLLRGLRYEAESYLASNGYVVSKDPNATEAYVKITVDDAVPGKDGFIKARLYIVDAAGQGIIYDKTCDVGSDSDGYPMGAFVRCALAEFMGKTAE